MKSEICANQRKTIVNDGKRLLMKSEICQSCGKTEKEHPYTSWFGSKRMFTCKKFTPINSPLTKEEVSEIAKKTLEETGYLKKEGTQNQSPTIERRKFRGLPLTKNCGKIPQNQIHDSVKGNIRKSPSREGVTQNHLRGIPREIDEISKCPECGSLLIWSGGKVICPDCKKKQEKEE